MSVLIHQFLCLNDNFGVLMHDPGTGRTASIDAPDTEAVLQGLAGKGWELTDILVTHHHADHTQGIPGLKARYPGVRVAGPAKEASRIGCLDILLKEGDEIAVGGLRGHVIEVPGHTAGHIAYYFSSEALLFSGDTLFSLGCGRPFEAPAEVLYESVMKLAALPGDTSFYCGHEYTASNARFALGVDPGNQKLRARADEVGRLRSGGQFTLPATLAGELETNPFLRAGDPAIKTALNLPLDSLPAKVFASLRDRKNQS